MTAAIWTAGAIVALAALGWWGQRRLIYFPDPDRPSAPPGVNEVDLSTEDGLTLTAWWLTPHPPAELAVIVFPGNAGNRAGRLPLAQALLDEGAAVLLVDYRGYGGNPGTPSEEGLLADARAARRWVADHHAGRVAYLGESIGSGPAAALAAETPPDSLILRSPFPSLPEVAEVHYGWLPVGWLLRDRYPVAEQIGSLDCPVTVVAGSSDSIVPLALSRQVAQAADAALVVVADADHNDPDLAWGPKLVSEVVADH